MAEEISIMSYDKTQNTCEVAYAKDYFSNRFTGGILFLCDITCSELEFSIVDVVYTKIVLWHNSYYIKSNNNQLIS